MLEAGVWCSRLWHGWPESQALRSASLSLKSSGRPPPVPTRQEGGHSWVGHRRAPALADGAVLLPPGRDASCDPQALQPDGQRCRGFGQQQPSLCPGSRTLGFGQAASPLPCPERREPPKAALRASPEATRGQALQPHNWAGRASSVIGGAGPGATAEQVPVQRHTWPSRVQTAHGHGLGCQQGT